MARSGMLGGLTALTMVLAAGSIAVTSFDARAQKGEPKCTKKQKAAGNCAQETHDDEMFFAGYWLARKGDYQAALHFLNRAENKSDPRILTYIGFANRKLGRMEEAMGYYARALEVDPNYTVARAYLGEAHIERGERPLAVDQLAEIKVRCGTTCEEYKELADALEKTKG